MALTTPVLYVFSVIFACLVVTSTVVGQDEEETAQAMAGVLGEDIEIPCDVEAFASSPQVAWKNNVFNTGRDPAVIYENGEMNPDHMFPERFSVSEDFTLKISGLQNHDVGEFFCESTLSDGTKEIKRYDLVLVEHPVCEGETSLTEGDDIMLTCSAAFSGSGGNMAWYVGDERLESEDQTSLEELRQIFKEKASGKFDKKTLTCKLMLGDTSYQCTKNMDIQYSPKVEFPDITGAEESAITLTCLAPSNPEPTITLYKQNDDTPTEIVSGDGVTVDIDVTTGIAKALFSSLDISHAGIYKCHAVNALDENSGTAQLIVTDKPAEPTPEPEKPDNGDPNKEPSTGNNGSVPGGEPSHVRQSVLLILSACLFFLHLL